jgi:hypothetical protein
VRRGAVRPIRVWLTGWPATATISITLRANARAADHHVERERDALGETFVLHVASELVDEVRMHAASVLAPLAREQLIRQSPRLVVSTIARRILTSPPIVRPTLAPPARAEALTDSR